jgi:hypothetical protein
MKKILLIVFMLMICHGKLWALTDTLDVATPAGTDTPTEGDDRIREEKRAWVERFAIDHTIPAVGTTYDGATVGYHKAIRLPEQAAAPSTPASYGGIYTKDSGTQPELFYREESSGDEVQITSNGALNIGNPDNYRDGMLVEYATADTVTVDPGNLEIDGTMVATTSTTTLTIVTNGDWADGSAAAGADYVYVGVSKAGAIKMCETAPTHSDYGVAVTAGIKRYATWDATVYRIIGWFYMDAAEQTTIARVGNLKDGEVPNAVQVEGTSNITRDGGAAIMTGMTIYFYSTGKPVYVEFSAPVGNASAGADTLVDIDVDGTNVATTVGSPGENGDPLFCALAYLGVLAEGEHTISVEWQDVAGIGEQNGTADGPRQLKVIEL